MNAAAQRACALAIGGLDPGGGAGVLADARAFTAAGAFACAAVAVATVQSTAGLARATPIATEQVIAEAREVLAHQRVRAIKTGALGSAQNVRGVAKLAGAHRGVPVVVDPVMLPTRGRGRLLAERAIEAMRSALIPRAALVTANAMEAAALTGRAVETVSDAHDAAHALVKAGAFAALVKGGHLKDEDATDVLALEDEVIELRGERLDLGGERALHGGGCVLASLVAGRVAADERAWPRHARAILVDAVRWAKRAHRRALSRAVSVGSGARVLLG